MNGHPKNHIYTCMKESGVYEKNAHLKFLVRTGDCLPTTTYWLKTGLRTRVVVHVMYFGSE